MAYVYKRGGKWYIGFRHNRGRPAPTETDEAHAGGGPMSTASTWPPARTHG
jgi:hypothetical protein